MHSIRLLLQVDKNSKDLRTSTDDAFRGKLRLQRFYGHEGTRRLLVVCVRRLPFCASGIELKQTPKPRKQTLKVI